MIAALVASALLAVQTPVSATGIPLDAPWKVTLYHLAQTKFVHPAWGWQHSERNYDLALQLARGDDLPVDTDVLFAAAFLHDIAAFEPCTSAKMEHGDCAAIQSQAVLRSAGFPMQKFALVQAAERTHMYYRNPGNAPEAIVLHDADSLDFLGDVGAARLIALTGQKATSFAPALKSLRKMLADIPAHLKTKTARRIAAGRVTQLRAFLNAVDQETFGGKAI